MYLFCRETHFHFITTKTQAVVTIYYHYILYTDPPFQRKRFQECNLNSYTRSCRNNYNGQGLWQAFTQSSDDYRGIIER